jgi:FkbM family methyltransferase
MSIINGIREFINWRILAPLRVNRFPFSFSSHAELGEDMMIRGILHHMGLPWAHKGFFIDIGAHHPVTTSNTWHFYRRGWHGINVDATPGSMNVFRWLRPRDTNLECCVVPESSGDVTFFCFDNPLLNTLDETTANETLRTKAAKLVSRVRVPTLTLTELCRRYGPKGGNFDLLSIDIEGVDEAVLRTHDWLSFRPRILVFERHGAGLGCLNEDSLIAFIEGKGYSVQGACRYSIIMADNNGWANF